MKQKLTHKERQKSQADKRDHPSANYLPFSQLYLFSLYISESFLSSLGSLFTKLIDINM